MKLVQFDTFMSVPGAPGEKPKVVSTGRMGVNPQHVVRVAEADEAEYGAGMTLVNLGGSYTVVRGDVAEVIRRLTAQDA